MFKFKKKGNKTATKFNLDLNPDAKVTISPKLRQILNGKYEEDRYQAYKQIQLRSSNKSALRKSPLRIKIKSSQMKKSTSVNKKIKPE